MNILKKLFQKKANDSQSTELRQTEREAIVDLLLLAMYADNHVSYEESQQVNESMQELGWDSPIDILSYMNGMTEKARSVRTDDTRKDSYLDGVAKRLQAPHAKELALKLLNELFYSDGVRENEEKNLFEVVQAKLNT